MCGRVRSQPSATAAAGTSRSCRDPQHRVDDAHPAPGEARLQPLRPLGIELPEAPERAPGRHGGGEEAAGERRAGQAWRAPARARRARRRSRSRCASSRLCTGATASKRGRPRWPASTRAWISRSGVWSPAPRWPIRWSSRARRRRSASPPSTSRGRAPASTSTSSWSVPRRRRRRSAAVFSPAAVRSLAVPTRARSTVCSRRLRLASQVPTSCAVSPSATSSTSSALPPAAA